MCPLFHVLYAAYRGTDTSISISQMRNARHREVPQQKGKDIFKVLTEENENLVIYGSP